LGFSFFECPDSYDRGSLIFTSERIETVGFIKADADGFLEEIIEKPTAKEVETIQSEQGRLGVSMNLFVMKAASLFLILAITSFHPVWNEKELPITVSLYRQ
jgi:glucose-1-phosphate adenylyltransferase